MELNAETIYWILKLDDIRGVFGFFSVVSLIASVLWCVMTFVDIDNGKRSYEPLTVGTNKGHIISFILNGIFATFTFLMISVLTFIPSTKEAAIIAGVEYQKDAITTLGRIPNKGLKLLEKYLDEQLEKDESKKKDE